MKHAAPPLHSDLKRELKQQLLAMSARSFEFFAGDFLVYVGLCNYVPLGAMDVGNGHESRRDR